MHEVIHDGLVAFRDDEAQVDGFAHLNFGLLHMNGGQILVEDGPLLEVGLCDQFGRLLLIAGPHDPDVLPLPHVLHGLAEDGIDHQLEDDS